MNIREYRASDLTALRRMHAAQGFGYPLPDLEGPLFVSKLVLEESEDAAGAPATRDEDGREVAFIDTAGDTRSDGHTHMHQAPRVAMAILQRLTVETYLLHDPSAGTPQQRWRNFVALHDAALRDAAARGLDDVQAFVPTSIARSFGRRLRQLGWTRDPWPCFSRRIP